MMHFNKDHKKYKLWSLGILLILLMAFPAIAQVNNSKLNKSVINKPMFDKTKKTPGGATAIQPTLVKLELTRVDVNIPRTRTPNKVNPGDSINLVVAVQNKGIMASGRFTVRIYIARDRKGNSQSTHLTSWHRNNNIAAKDTEIFNESLTIPEGQGSGNWFIVAKVEQGVSVVDSGSCRSPFYVAKPTVLSIPRPMLGVRILSFSPERPRRGESVDITIEVKNGMRIRPSGGSEIGSPASNINVTWGFYTDCADGAHIHDFMAQRVPGTLEYGQSKTLTVRKIFPRDAPSRTIKIRATAKAAGSRLVTSDCEDILVFFPKE